MGTTAAVDVSTQQGQYLVAKLDVAAEQIRTVGFKLIKLMSNLTGTMLSQEDVRHYALSAAFDAFIELGGDPNQPNDFAWDDADCAEALVKTGLTCMRRELIGRKTEFGDVATRLTQRKDGAFVDRYQWTAWETTFPVPERRKGRGTIAAMEMSEYMVATEQERRLEEQELFTFEDDLRQALADDEEAFQWLVERHRDGVPQDEQIDRFVAQHPAYQGTGGRRRAENYINQRISRARKKAARRLRRKWEVFALEVQ